VIRALGVRREKHEPLAGGAAGRIERRPGRKSGEAGVAQIVETDPAQAPLVPDEAAGLDDRERDIEARGEPDDRGDVGRDVGLKEGDTHGRSAFDADVSCDIVRLRVAVLARCASVF
jgi:hypothetical protein